MTNNLYDNSGVANRTGRLAVKIIDKYPHLKFGVWDLSEFLPYFHNVRRTMIFIECEKSAKDSIISFIAEDSEFRNCLVFEGERKPKMINENWAAAKSNEIRDVVVILTRTDFEETKPLTAGKKEFSNIRVPSLERMLVDLLSYSLREWLPIPIKETSEVFFNFLKKPVTRYGVLSRYATRRYLGWFVDIMLYKLSKNDNYSFDPRHLANGKRYLEAIKEVDNS